LEADVIVLAAGFDSMNTTLRKAMGDQIANRRREVWDLDDGSEISAVSPSEMSPGLLLIVHVDVETLWTSRTIVHGWKSGAVPHLLEVPGASDQSAPRRRCGVIDCQHIDLRSDQLLEVSVSFGFNH
jgi:hypothetical protein